MKKNTNDNYKKNIAWKKLRTKRLSIEPLNLEELAEKVEREEEPHLKEAYGQMLSSCKSNVEASIWYTCWDIRLTATDQIIGSLGFLGEPKDATVEIGYGIDEYHRNRGYATEAARCVIDWALSQDVLFVKALTEADNTSSQRVLEKLGFCELKEDDEIVEFEYEKPVNSWVAVYMCIGMAVGMAVGKGLDFDFSTGTGLGICLGLILGVVLEHQEKAEIQKLKNKRDESN